MKRLAIFFLVGLILLQVFDAYSTYTLIDVGFAEEYNIVMANVIEFYGLLNGLILIKLLACVILLLFLFRIRQPMKKREEIYTTVGFGVLFFYYFYIMSMYNLQHLIIYWS